MLLTVILDIFLVLLIALGIFIGIKRGFIKTVAKPVRFFASLATAYMLANPISKAIVEPILGAPLANQMKTYLLDNCPNITPETAADEMPTLLKFAASLLDIDISSLSPERIIDSLVDALANPVIHIFSLVLTFIVLYFVAKLVYSLLISILNSVFDNGFLSASNKLLGCVFNTLAAIVVAWLFTVGFEFVIHLPVMQNYQWAVEFEGGFIYRFFNKLNPVDLLLNF